MDDNSHRPDTGVDTIERLIERFERRIRVQRAVAGLVEGSCLALMMAGVIIAAVRTGWIDADYIWIWAVIALGFALLGTLYRGLQRVDTIAAAQKLDQSHGLHDRLSTAMSLAHDPNRRPEDDDFVRAQLQDALGHADIIDPSRAAPWRRPPDTMLLALVALAVLTIGILPMPDHEQELPPSFEASHRAVLDDATLAMERDRLDEFRRRLEELPDDEAQKLADEIEALLDAVEERQISEREFSDRIDELLQEYFGDDIEQREIDSLSQALAEAAGQTTADHQETLEENPELQQALEAIEQGDFDTASEALSALAERLDTEDLSAEDAERLADVFEQFSEQLEGREEQLQELFEEHQDRFEELADQFDDHEGLDGADEQLLEDARQAMEDAAAERDEFSDSESKRQLERLSRELDQAAHELRDDNDQPDDGQQADGDPQPQDGQQSDGDDDPGAVDDELAPQEDGQRPAQQEGSDGDEPDYKNEIGRHVEDASEQLQDLDERKRRQEQREQARRQLEEMKENMSRSDSRDSERDERRGEQMEDFMDRARGDDGEEQQGQPGGEDGEEMAAERGADEGGDQDSGEFDSDDAEFGGDTASEGGPDDDGQSLGDADGEDQDYEYTREQLQGSEAQEGPSRSEIIDSAAEQGFATTEYEEVYADYEDIAEEVMDREQVPDGYRYYIKRYFQLIRPQQ